MATELRKLGATVEEGADFIAVTPPTQLAAAAHPHLRRPPHRDVLFAGGLQPAAAAPCRCASTTRSCVGKTFPDYFETLFAVAATDAADVPGHHRRRAHRLGQGHARQRAGRSALGYHFLDSGALYRAPHWPRCAPASAPTTSSAWRSSPPTSTCASRPARS